MENIQLELDRVCYSYGKMPAISDFSLQIERGSFTSILGPSGCGKTTLLRMISGFLEPTAGKVLINGIDQKGIAPNQRKIGMVFQDYALFPHMTVEENLLYGLKITRNYKKDFPENYKSRKEFFAQLVMNTARSLGIENLMKRFPSELSGGQQQRAALGRALVLEPEILLMDEPLSSLDTKLRTYVREELKEIQNKVGITTIYVTHDQDEALSLSDTIAVINDGKLLQKGSPAKIYFEPRDKFTADFVGRANFIEESNHIYMIRPEWFEISREKTPDTITGKIISQSFLGEKTRIKVQVEGGDTLIVDLRTIDLEDSIESGQVNLKIVRKHQIQ